MRHKKFNEFLVEKGWQFDEDMSVGTSKTPSPEEKKIMTTAADVAKTQGLTPGAVDAKKAQELLKSPLAQQVGPKNLGKLTQVLTGQTADDQVTAGKV